MRLTRAGVLVLVAFSVPVAIELRTLFGFFGVELSMTAIAVFEAALIAMILVAYNLQADADSSTTAR